MQKCAGAFWHRRSVKLAFFRHRDAQTMPLYHFEMLHNVAGPMVSMIGGETNKIFGGEYKFSVFYKDVVRSDPQRREDTQVQTVAESDGARSRRSARIKSAGNDYAARSDSIRPGEIAI
jgi:hypothetical protein